MKVDKIFSLMSERGISAKELSEKTGISSGNISDWKSGRSTPKGETLIKIADYFGVSVDYLLGRESSIKKEPDASGELSVKNVKFIGRDGVVKYKKLTPEMISMLEQLPDSDEDL